MKIIYYLKMIFRSIQTQFLPLAICYVIFPFGLAFFLSFAMSGVLEPSIDDPNIEVYVQDEDQTEQSKAIAEAIHSDSLERIFSVQNREEDAEFIIRIPSGFQNQSAAIEIEGKNAASRNTGRLLQLVITDLTKQMSESTKLAKKIQGASLSQQELLDLQKEIIALSESETIKGETYHSDSMLSSREYFSVVVISYLLILFLSSSVSAEGMTESIGFTKRWKAAPITKWEAWFMEVLGNSIYFSLFICLYVLAWRLIGGIFTQNLFYLLIIIFLHAIMAALVNSFITHTFSNAVGKVIVNGLLFFVLIFGGMIGPLEKMTGLAIFEKLNSETVTYFITKPYWTLMQHDSWNRLMPILSQLLIVVLILAMMNVISIRFRKKVFK